MDLYLIRHGKAEAGRDDFQRELTQASRRDCARLSRWLAPEVHAPVLVIHSPLVRARQTAELFQAEWRAVAQTSEGLRPESEPDGVRDLIREAAPEVRSLVLVGHNPFMERCAALLMAEGACEVLRFGTGTVAKLEPLSPGAAWTRYRCRWLVGPGLLPRD